MASVETATEVVIVGAGISGCATAYELASRGVRVSILEKDEVAYEASGRNFGATGVLGKHAVDLASASVNRWDELATELPYDFQYTKVGRLYPAHSRDDLPALEDVEATAAKQNVPIEMLSGAEVKRRFPVIGAEVIAAAFSPQDATVDPAAATRGFAQLAKDRGVTIRCNCAVKTLDVEAGRIRGVVTEHGYVRADAVLVAAGVWSARLLDRVGVHIPMQYVALCNALTEPRPPVLPCFIRGPDYGALQMKNGAIRIGGGYRRSGARHYVTPQDFRDVRLWLPRFVDKRKEIEMRLDWRLVSFQIKSALGGTAVLKKYTPPIPEHFLRRKFEIVKGIVPAIKDARLVSFRAGLIDLTLDALPVLGRIDTVDGLYVAMGFNGQGFSLGPVVGRLIAEHMTVGRTSISLTPYRWSRFSGPGLRVPRRIV
jgi:glycine/D-amino acid oxidase-like deaminating enzyme